MMKPADIKSMFRYCISEMQKQGYTVAANETPTIWFNKPRSNEPGKWELIDDKKVLDPIACVILTRDLIPSDSTLREFDATISPSRVMLLTFTDHLELPLEWVYGFLDGCENLLTDNDKQGFDVGQYVFKRLGGTGEPIKVDCQYKTPEPKNIEWLNQFVIDFDRKTGKYIIQGILCMEVFDIPALDPKRERSRYIATKPKKYVKEYHCATYPSVNVAKDDIKQWAWNKLEHDAQVSGEKFNLDMFVEIVNGIEVRDVSE